MRTPRTFPSVAPSTVWSGSQDLTLRSPSSGSSVPVPPRPLPPTRPSPPGLPRPFVFTFSVTLHGSLQDSPPPNPCHTLSLLSRYPFNNTPLCRDLTSQTTPVSLSRDLGLHRTGTTTGLPYWCSDPISVHSRGHRDIPLDTTELGTLRMNPGSVRRDSGPMSLTRPDPRLSFDPHPQFSQESVPEKREWGSLSRKGSRSL